MKTTVTIRDLARMAGCSRTTVSLALRNSARVSPRNRAKIQSLARKHGYLRDTVVSTLMTRLRISRRARSTEKLALLTWWNVPWWSVQYETNTPFNRQLYEGIAQRAKDLGYDVEVFWAKEPGMTGRRLSKILHTRGIRGIILLSMTRARGHVRLDWPRFAAATNSYTILKPNLHRAIASHYQGMILALRNLRRLGYGTIGYANLVQNEDMVNEAWLASYMAYQFRVHGKVKIPPLLMKSWDRKAAGKWLLKYQPEVVIGSDIQCLNLIRELGCQVPDEIGFVLLDCLPGRSDCAGIHQNRDKSGAAAVDLVVEQLESNDFGLPASPKTVLIDSVWKPGLTLKSR